MALLNLPNGSQYDTELGFYEQSSGASEYAHSLLDIPHTVGLEVKEYCGDDLNSDPVYRYTSRTHEDIPNGFKVVNTRTYVHPSGHRCCGAVRRHNFVLEAI